MSKILSNFCKIAKTASLYVRPILYNNEQITVSVVNQLYTKLPQLNFINREAIKPASKNTQIDTSYENETGRGAIQVPSSKDYYYGEGSY